MSLTRDNAEKQTAKWMTIGDENNQTQNPLRRNQTTTGDMKAKSPLQKYQMPKKYFWNSHPRATTALTVATFLTIFIGWVMFIINLRLSFFPTLKLYFSFDFTSVVKLSNYFEPSELSWITRLIAWHMKSNFLFPYIILIQGYVHGQWVFFVVFNGYLISESNITHSELILIKRNTIGEEDTKLQLRCVSANVVLGPWFSRK